MTPKLAALQRLHDAMMDGRKPDNDTIIAAFGCRRLKNGWDATALIGWIMAPADIRAMGAAKALHEALLPERSCAITFGGEYGATVTFPPTWDDLHLTVSNLIPARAWALAIIKALMAQEGE